jgi:hypothetical protein
MLFSNTKNCYLIDCDDKELIPNYLFKKGIFGTKKIEQWNIFLTTAYLIPKVFGKEVIDYLYRMLDYSYYRQGLLPCWKKKAKFRYPIKIGLQYHDSDIKHFIPICSATKILNANGIVFTLKKDLSIPLGIAVIIDERELFINKETFEMPLELDEDFNEDEFTRKVLELEENNTNYTFDMTRT